MDKFAGDRYQNGYHFLSDINHVYNAIDDALSKKLFVARMELDLYGSLDGFCKLIDSAFPGSGNHLLKNFLWMHTLQKSQAPVYIYGALMIGEALCKILRSGGINVKGFFDKNYSVIGSVCGLPVLPPPINDEYRKNLPPDFYILISAAGSADKIFDLLISNQFPKERILPGLEIKSDFQSQYFEFMDLYDPTGAFVDAGCFNCETSELFARKCSGNYSKIFAFEPEPNCYKICEMKAKNAGLHNLQLLQAGLWHENTTASFCSEESNGGSRISQFGKNVVSLVRLDDVVADSKVSFIKMDIEGAELNALIGASQTIQRDKPLCAICVYHKSGDLAVITAYLKYLVPEYRFRVRHYSTTAHDTVLYAFV